jgi:hypothetical protein
MASLRKPLWMIVALAAMPAPAAAQEICNALTRIAAAARETPPFGSVQRRLANGEAIVPGFSADRCRASATEVNCGLFQRSDQRVEWDPEISCPGFTLVQPATGGAAAGRRPVRRFGRVGRTYAGSGLRISFGLDCTTCNPPPTSFFTVTLEGQGRPEE